MFVLGTCRKVKLSRRELPPPSSELLLELLNSHFSVNGEAELSNFIVCYGFQHRKFNIPRQRKSLGWTVPTELGWSKA